MLRVDVSQSRTYIRSSNAVETSSHPMNDDGPAISAASVGDQRVLRERDQFRALANAVPQLVWMADANGSIHWYNQRWYDFTGTTLEEMQGWGWTKVHHPKHLERVAGRLRQCFETGDPWEDTFPLRGANGEYRWFLSRAVPIRRDDGSVAGWFGTNTDITEQLNAEEAIRESEHRLRRALEMERNARTGAERATKARDETLAIVAHDLRNPVHAIMGAAAMLGLQFTDEKSRRHLAVVERSAIEMERLISDLLDVARIDAGTFALHRASLDASTLIEETVEVFQTKARAKDVALRCEVAEDVKPIDADHDRLIRVLSNLLSNALKFSLEGRPVSVRAANDERAVRFSVKDSGAGIPESDLPRVFDRFWQADRASRTGAGLGLSICKGIVQAHGGRIWVASKVNRGTTFYFTIPVADR
jgi:PAS domain S-box-containing protein